MTLGQYAETWLAQRTLKHTTHLHYRRILAHFAPLDDLPLESLTPQRVREWHATTLVNRPTYRSHAYGLLHAICATAVKDGLLTSNPCQIERAMRSPASVSRSSSASPSWVRWPKPLSRSTGHWS